MNKPTKTGRAVLRRNALAVALAVGLGLSGGVALAQSTSGHIFGNAEASQTIQAVSTTGLTRTVTVGANGNYDLRNLPAGQYTVNLMDNGAVVSSHTVTVTGGSGAQVNFGAQQLATIEVSASALPPIDVSNVSPSMTITAAQLQKLPVGQSANSIALMAPGVVDGSHYFSDAVSFMGAGITENAYYVNGYNTTALYDYTGTAYDLPYGAIAQQQTMIGGYSAKYGRADGGVISQIGARGTNEWHFGARIQWVPRTLRADPVNQYYPDAGLVGDEEYADKTVQPGDLYRYRAKNKGWDFNYSAYIGGPIVEDKLFVYVAAEQDRQAQRSIGSAAGSHRDNYLNYRTTKWYGKLDWNINEDNLLEYTLLKTDERNGWGPIYNFDYDTMQSGELVNATPSWDEYHNKTQIFQYTGYLSDNATLSVLYGKTDVNNPRVVPVFSPLPFIAGSSRQDPAITGGNSIVNNQTETQIFAPNRGQGSRGLRADFTYQLGDHLLQAGIDNLKYTAQGVGPKYSGPGYVWNYGVGKPGDNINAVLDVGAPGGDGYYVSQIYFTQASSMSAEQKAWYIMDDWQVTPNLLVSLGLRNDNFTNYNPDHVAFVKQTGQYAPRVGFSWDVNGDSSLKIYGNVGRYFLALPQAAANRSATASLYTNEYFTYTGIDANGIPTGLTPVPNVAGTGPAGPVSSNAEFGELPDPTLVTSTNLKSQYQDELILGGDMMIWQDWVVGAKFTYRTLRSMIDDGCSPTAIHDKLVSTGYNPDEWDWNAVACHSFNPGGTNDYLIPSLNGLDPITVSVTRQEAGFPKPQRDYYGLNLHLEHPFDGTWMGRVDYTFSRNWGNAEGQVRSDIGQGDISLTEDWDYPELMEGARGYLSNDRRHQIKAYGAWQLNPEWMVSGVLTVQSGSPISCLGFYGPTPEDSTTNNPGFGYGSDYHWCEGKIWTPGQERTSWTNQVNLGVEYRPSFADQKLAFKAYVFNVLDSQKPLQLEPNRFSRYSRTVNNTYTMPLFYQSPRYVRFTVSYDY